MSSRRTPLDRRRLRVLAAMLIGVALTVGGLAACSSSGASSSAGGSASGSSAPTGGTAGGSPSGSPIKIGYAVAETGFGAADTKNTVGIAQAWAASVNAAGGIGGHPVSITAEDTAGNPSTALAVVKALVGSDHVQVVMLADPSVEAAVGPYLSGSGVPIIGTAFDGLVWNALPHFFAASSVSPQQNYGFPYAAAKVGHSKKMGQMVCAEVPACLLLDQETRQVASALDMDYVGVTRVSASAPSYSAPCISLVQQGVDNISLVLSADVQVKVVHACQQQGYSGSFTVAGYGFVPSLMTAIKGAKYVGTIDGFPWWSSAPPVKAYQTAVAKYGSGADPNSPFSTVTWAELELLRAALSSETLPADVTGQDALNAMYTIKNETLGGLLPQPVTYTEGKPPTPLACYWLFRDTIGQTAVSVAAGTSGNQATGDLASTCYNPGSK